MADKAKIEQGVRLLLEGIGEDLNREGLLETPQRIAKMYEEIFSGMNRTPEEILSKVFHSSGSEMVIEQDITFYSMCEHHFLPFYGKAHVAYVPDGQVVGLSKIARTVELYARRPQLQEQLTDQIADAIMDYLKPKGAIVMIEAEHMCMTMRGVQKPGTKTVTYASRGIFREEQSLADRFLMLVK